MNVEKFLDNCMNQCNFISQQRHLNSGSIAKIASMVNTLVENIPKKLNDKERSHANIGLQILMEEMVNKQDNRLQSCLEVLGWTRAEILKEAKPPSEKKMCSRNSILETNGISPKVLDQCGNVPRFELLPMAREVYHQFGISELSGLNPVRNNERVQRGQRPEDKVIRYLVKHKNDNDRLRDNMRGYIGYEENEICKNLESACWNFALTGARATQGPNQIDQNRFIEPDHFYCLFGPYTLERARELRIFDIMGLLQSRAMPGAGLNALTEGDKALIRKHEREISHLFKRALNRESDVKALQKDLLILYLKIIGYQPLSGQEADQSPYAIGMQTNSKDSLEWGHWGLEIRTDQNVHFFDTMPQHCISHKKGPFSKTFTNSSKKNVFTVAVKSIPQQSVNRVNDTIYFILRTQEQQRDHRPRWGI